MKKYFSQEKTLYDHIATEAPPKKVRFVTAKVASRILRCHPSTITIWRQRGYISFVRSGRFYFYRLHEIEAISHLRFDDRIEKLTKRLKLNNKTL